MVNGVRYKVAGLVAGEELTLDVANAMQPGYNLVSLTAYGKPGSWASLLIWEGED